MEPSWIQHNEFNLKIQSYSDFMWRDGVVPNYWKLIRNYLKYYILDLSDTPENYF